MEAESLLAAPFKAFASDKSTVTIVKDSSRDEAG